MSAANASELLELLRPRSVAIIGASSNPAKFSGRILPYLLRHGFSGEVYPINARREEVMGVRCYPDLMAVPGLVECVVYSIAAGDIEAVLEACERKGGVRLLVVSSAGFAERGDDEGRRLQDRLVRFARESGARVIGPNCIGFLNLVDKVAVAAAAVLEWPALHSGGVGLISQSGGLAFGSALLGAHEKGIGFSRVVTTGNEADTDVTEWAQALVADDSTDAIALTIEGVRDGPAFRAFLRRARQAGKPVVILKSGRSLLGEKMAASHTGAIAGSQSVFEAVCAQYGVTLVDDIDELYEIAAMFAKLRGSGKLRSPDAGEIGNNVSCAALSISGGHIGLFADLASRQGASFPVLAAETQDGLAKHLANKIPILNPVDLTGGTVSDPGLWGRCLRLLLDDPGVQIVVPILTIAKNYDSVCRDLIMLANADPKPVIVAWIGGSLEGEGKALLRESPLPVFDSQRLAARALSALHTYWQASATREDHPKVADARLSAVRCELLRLASLSSTLDERVAKGLLAPIGLPVPKELIASSAAEAQACADEIGYPVVLKGLHSDIVHKSDAGIVRLNLRTSEEVRAAFSHIQSSLERYRFDDTAVPVLVQEMVPPGIELILGIQRDPVFGPVVMFGLGGVFVEVFEDVALRPAPVTQSEALAMIEEIRGVAILKGARGRRPADLDAIARLIVALGDFAAAHADIVREIDINPLIVVDRENDRLQAVDALLVLDRKDHA